MKNDIFSQVMSIVILLHFTSYFIYKKYLIKKYQKQQREAEEKKKAIGLLMGSLVAHKEKQEMEAKVRKFMSWLTICLGVAYHDILKNKHLNPKTQDEKDAPPNTEFL